MTYTLRVAVLAAGLAAAGAAVAQQAQYPPQMPQTMGGVQMGQMGPMMGQTTPMMNDPRIQAQMTEMMRGCHRTMAQMQQMHPGSDGRR